MQVQLSSQKSGRSRHSAYTGRMLTIGNSNARATVLIVLSSCGFGSLTTITLLVTRSGLPLLPAMVWRYLIAGLVLFLLARSLGARPISRSRAFRLVLVGGLGQALITYLSLRALDYLPVGPLAFLFTLTRPGLR